MSENALGGADEIRTSSVLSSQRDENGSRIGQGDPSCDGRPAGERRTLEVKEEKDAAKEAFNGGALAQLLSGPGGNTRTKAQSRTILWKAALSTSDRDPSRSHHQSSVHPS